MRYPNLRYGNPAELQFYAMAYTVPALAKQLRRDERTVRDWLNAKQRVPWWVPEIMRLWRNEHANFCRQLELNNLPKIARPPLAVVTPIGELTKPNLKEKKPQTLTDLRLDDFDLEPTSACGTGR
ncbi:hypothetical protein GTP23_12150 [Pseudoduganella sp. FT93W]|uniref:Uncharacterized protein n=1 Tax=Duganella fentianensis TaxID=2692177 RepID=A0A845HXS6_9BURK|nr:hypothetical protein [Duganella fentianensis]MYN45799.1 hypothetical protein [Duganella fentianensis]